VTETITYPGKTITTTYTITSTIYTQVLTTIYQTVKGHDVVGSLLSSRPPRTADTFPDRDQEGCRLYHHHQPLPGYRDQDGGRQHGLRDEVLDLDHCQGGPDDRAGLRDVDNDRLQDLGGLHDNHEPGEGLRESAQPALPWTCPADVVAVDHGRPRQHRLRDQDAHEDRDLHQRLHGDGGGEFHDVPARTPARARTNALV